MPEKTKDSLTISLDKPNEEFTRFLDDIQNRRIIFSGAFGSGKTYFLKKFFADSEKYCYIRLAPVNYSVPAGTEAVQPLVHRLPTPLAPRLSNP